MVDCCGAIEFAIELACNRTEGVGTFLQNPQCLFGAHEKDLE